MKPLQPMKPLEPMAPAERWWPEDLGEPASTGAQDDLRYAFFPRAKRLLVERNGDLTTYDSGEHRISGVSQQGSDEKSLAFSSAAVPVPLDKSRKVG